MLLRYPKNFLQLQVMGYDQNLHKCYAQLTVVGICKSHLDGIPIDVELASCYFRGIRIKGYKEYVQIFCRKVVIKKEGGSY